MITDIILYVLSAILGMISLLLQYASLAIPNGIAAAYQQFFGYLQYVQGVLPLQQILQAMGFVLLVFVGKYLVKVFLFGFSIIPFLGKHTELPHHQPYDKGRQQRSRH